MTYKVEKVSLNKARINETMT